MKAFVEEYGGVIVTCIMGMMLIGLMYSMAAQEGGLRHLAELFFEGIGTIVQKEG